MVKSNAVYLTQFCGGINAIECFLSHEGYQMKEKQKRYQMKYLFIGIGIILTVIVLIVLMIFSPIQDAKSVHNSYEEFPKVDLSFMLSDRWL